MQESRERLLPLKDRSIAAAPYVGDGPEVEYRFQGNAGLVLAVIKPNRAGRSTRTWRVHYSVTKNGQRLKRKLKIGRYPAVPLAEARRRAAEIMEAVHEGRDPALERATARNAPTFAALLDEFIGDRERRGKKTSGETRRVIERDALPIFGQLPIGEVDDALVERAVKRVVDRGAPHQAARLLRHIGTVLRYGLRQPGWRRAGLKVNWATLVDRPIEPGVRDRALSDEEISRLWRRLDASDRLHISTAAAIRTILLTAQRPSEVAEMEWAEIRIEAGRAIWRIPESRAKNGRQHAVPLSRAVVRLLRDLRRSQGAGRRYVFPSPLVGDDRPLDAARVSKALRRITHTWPGGKAGAHDMRRTAATGMARLEIDDSVIEKVLNHATAEKRSVALKHYIRHDYIPQKARALNTWGGHIEALDRSSRSSD
jgi:integrase